MKHEIYTDPNTLRLTVESNDLNKRIIPLHHVLAIKKPFTTQGNNAIQSKISTNPMLDASEIRENYESIRGSSKFSRYQM